MPNTFTENTFSTTYKDDYRDSDNYHRILFNSGRALQARELTQMQTIIQEEIGRFGRNIFKDGAAVNPGGPTIKNNVEFVKLNTTTGATPTNSLVGNEFENDAGVKARIIRVLDAEDSDPATIFVQYTDTSSGTSGETPIRFEAGETINDGSTNLVVQTENTTENPAVGQGTEISNAGGDFFVRGHFVFALPQTIVLDKYNTTPTAVVGFRITEDIVTTSDTTALFDNQGATPNRSAPGADRYRIRLVLIDKADIQSDENFVYYCNVVNGEIVDEARGEDNYNAIREVMATRTKEESGNYIVRDFRVDYRKDSSVDANIIASVSPGIAYVNGYRATQGNVPVQIRMTKPRTTQTVQNETVGISYGNYVIIDELQGNIVGSGTSRFTAQNLSTSASDPSGSVIGTARVRYVEEDGANFRAYLFDIEMNSGQSFRDVRSIGTGADDFARILTEGGVANLKDATKRSLLYALPKVRPDTISDVDFEVQRVIEGTVTSGTSFSLAVSGNERFSNVSQWFATSLDSGGIVPGATFTLTGGGTGVNVENLPGTGDFAVYAKVNKTIASPRVKTLTELTRSGSVESDGSGTVFFNLHRSDLFKVLSIKETDSDGRDLSSNFRIDNGQREGYYDNARLILASGASAPATVFARFQHFTHGAGDYFDVTSYTGQVDYERIPYFVNPRGQSISLRNVIDFRSSVDSDGNFSGTRATRTEVPTNGDVWQGDVDYYMPRSDRLVINEEGVVKHIEGEPSFIAALPKVPVNTLPLFNINFPPYVLSDSDISTVPVKHQRYQMKDIARIEERIDVLEETVSLSLLEVETSSLLVLDSAGNLRTKSGFFVDNFSDRAFSDTQAGDYRASINPTTQTLHVPQATYGLDLSYDSASSSNTILKGDNVYLKYTHSEVISQTLISGTENVNPFAVISGTGNLTLSPASDTWIETTYIPENVIDGGTQEVETGVVIDEGELAVGTANVRAGRRLDWVAPTVNVPLEGFEDIPAIVNPFAFAGWNDFANWNWNGENNEGRVTEEGSFRQRGRGRRRGNARSFSQKVINAEWTKREEVGDRRINLVFLPTMRSRKIVFRAEGLTPNTQYFPFFDGVKVDAFCRSESSFERAASRDTNSPEYGAKFRNNTEHPEGQSTLTTDANGELIGSFFLPSNEKDKFKAGTREFKLLDISINQNDGATSRATANYHSEGQLDTRQKDIVSTRMLDIATRRWTEVTWSDPLAQTFRTPTGNGIYVTKVDTFLRSTETVVPIQLQIRPVEDGAPSSDLIMPNGIKFVNAGDVANNQSSTTQAQVLANPTTFEFDEPVFLEADKEYAIVLLADTTNYESYVAETYEYVLGSTEQRINRQPSMGSLFKSQNGTIWTPDQTKDMAFKIYQAQFNTAGGYAIFDNRDIQPTTLSANPIFADSGDATMTMLYLDHGFQVNDTINVQGLDSATRYNGILGTSIMGDRTITAVDGFGLQFEADSSTTSAGRFGGSNVFASRQFNYDAFNLTLDAIVPEDTTLDVEAQWLTGKSFAGTETGYARTPGTGYSKEVVIKEDVTFEFPNVIATPEKESTTGKSVIVKANLNTIDANVAPFIDGQRASMILKSNRVDDQTVTNPINEIAETDAAFGSAMAKHITSVQNLVEDAVGLKVILAAIRPNTASIEVYHRTATGEENIFDKPFIQQTVENTVAPDANNFREYRYLIGGTEGTLTPFTQYQIKIVLKSTNSSKVPVLKDLRVIAMAT